MVRKNKKIILNFRRLKTRFWGLKKGSKLVFFYDFSGFPSKNNVFFDAKCHEVTY